LFHWRSLPAFRRLRAGINISVNNPTRGFLPLFRFFIPGLISPPIVRPPSHAYGALGITAITKGSAILGASRNYPENNY